MGYQNTKNATAARMLKAKKRREINEKRRQNFVITNSNKSKRQKNNDDLGSDVEINLNVENKDDNEDDDNCQNANIATNCEKYAASNLKDDNNGKTIIDAENDFHKM